MEIEALEELPESPMAVAPEGYRFLRPEEVIDVGDIVSIDGYEGTVIEVRGHFCTVVHCSKDKPPSKWYLTVSAALRFHSVRRPISRHDNREVPDGN